MNLHLGELVWGASSDLGNTQSSQLLLELLQLCLELTLALVAQLVRLELGCTNISNPSSTPTPGSVQLLNAALERIIIGVFHHSSILPHVQKMHSEASIDHPNQVLSLGLFRYTDLW